MSVCRVGLLACFVFMSCGRATAALAGDYSYAFITVPGASVTGVTGINPAGEVTGTYSEGDFTQHGFTLSGSTFTMFDGPGASGNAQPVAVNPLGEVVGNYKDGDGTSHIFTRMSGGESIKLKLGVPAAASAVAAAINKRGEIAGYYTTDTTGATLAFTNDNGSTKTLIPFSATSSYATSINNDGTVVGSYSTETYSVLHGFSYSKGVYSAIDPPNSTGTSVLTINNSGLIGGTYQAGSVLSHGFIFANGRYRTYDYPGGLDTLITNILTTHRFVGTWIDVIGFHSFNYVDGHFYNLVPPGTGGDSVSVSGIGSQDTLAGSLFGGLSGTGFLAVCAAKQEPCTQ